MRAETWELLNGTGWGDDLRTINDHPYDGEIEIPMFMLSDYRTVSMIVPVSAYRAQGMGRAKRQERAEKKQRRDFRNGIAYTGLMFGLLVLANLLVEVMCG